MNDEFLNIVAEVLKTDPSLLNKESTAESVPEWDSLNHWTVIGKLEEVYEIEFTLDEATEFKNLGDIYDTIERKLKEKQT